MIADEEMIALDVLSTVIVPVNALADAAIIALAEIVADAIDVGLLVTLDQSTELAVFE